jgi:hypothetical protein
MVVENVAHLTAVTIGQPRAKRVVGRNVPCWWLQPVTFAGGMGTSLLIPMSKIQEHFSKVASAGIRDAQILRSRFDLQAKSSQRDTLDGARSSRAPTRNGCPRIDKHF